MSQKHTKQTRETAIQPAAEDLYRVLFEQAADGIFIVSTQGRCLEVNQQSCKMLGYSREELLAMSLPDLISAEDLVRTPMRLTELNLSEPVVVERLLRCRDGHLLPVEIKAQKLADGRVVGHVRDVTERKRMEEASRQSEEKYRSLIDSQDAAISTIDAAGVIHYMNQIGAAPLAGSPEAVVGRNLRDFFPPPIVAQQLQYIRQVITSGQGLVDEYQNIVAGRPSWRRVSIQPVRNAAGQVVLATINSVDITERKQAEAALRESEERFRTLYQTMAQGIVYQDAEGKIISANPAAERILGLTLDQMQGRTSIDPRWRAIHADGTEFPGEAHPAMASLRTGQPVNDVIMGIFHPQEEQYVWININAAPQFKPGQTQPYQVYAIFEDITTRKLNEDLVHARLRLIEFADRHTVKELLQATLDEAGALVSSPIGFYHFVDPDQTSLILQAWSTRTRAEFCTAHGEDSHYPLDQAGVWADCARERRPLIHNDYSVLENRRGLPPGHANVVREMVIPIMRGGRVVAIMGVGNKPTNYTQADLEIINIFADMSWEIVERKQADEALRQNERRLREAQALGRIGDWELDPETGQMSHSEIMYELFGWDPTQSAPDMWQTLKSFHPDDIPIVQAHIRHALETAEGWEHDVRVHLPDGREVWHHGIGAPVTDSQGKVIKIRGTTQDITERKQAEEKLRESQMRVELALQGADMGMWDWYVQTGQTVFNERWAEIIGYSLAELEPISIQTWIDVCHPDDLKVSDALLRHHFAGKTEFYECEARLKHKNGEWVWVIDRGKVVEWDADGKPVRMTGTHLDITERKQAEQALLELNRTLEERVKQRTAEVQDLYDNAPTGYHSLDVGGNYVMVNQTELDWLGYSRVEVIGRPLASFLTSASAAMFHESFRAFKQRGGVRDLEYIFIRKDGSTLPTLLNGTAIYDEQGNFLMSRSTLFDNTERKKAEAALKESEEQNRLLFEESPDAVILFDETGRVVRANRAAEILTGCANVQLAGRTLDELRLLPAEQVEKLAAAVLQALQLADSFATAEFSLKRASGESREVGARVFGLRIQDRQHYLTTMRDITADKQSAETLRQANAELARAARTKDEFLANMSHELRTPLNAILGLSEALLEHTHGPLTERQQKSLHHIEASGQHLLALITDILDLSKVEAGRMELLVEPVRVADACQASLLFVKEIAQKKQLLLGFHLNDQLAVVQADSKRLKQMLVNLLSNAVKFTPAGGQVSLEVSTDAEAGVIRFAVQDTGIGIAPEDMARLFQPFTQLDSSLNRHHEGTGLGLALVRRLAELHGGSVTVESVVDQGSRFTIALPYPSPERGNSLSLTLPAEQQTRGSLPRRALVVEDSESEAEQLARYLQETNIHVTIHLQGEGALEQAARLQPDVILLDLLMPNQSGWKVLSQLKADPRTREIPVIIISIVDERARGIAAGAAQYLVKPVSREGLWQALRMAVLAPKATREALVIVPNPQPVLPGALILLAEDNEVNIVTIEDYLQSKGYQVVVARNGQEALDLVSRNQPDLILMDIQMPKMDGLEATRRLRARPEFATTPIIALTALAMPGDRERCLEAGVNEYLTKPVGLKMLAQKIENLLEKKSNSVP